MHTLPNILGALDDALEFFKTSGDEPTRLFLGRRQVAALKDIAHWYTSNAAGDEIGPNYRGIPIEETGAEDQLDFD